MKKKIWLLLLLSAVFYGLIHLSGHFPGLLQGKFTLVDERPAASIIFGVVAGLIFSFSFSLVTYLFLHHGYPRRRYLLLFIVLPFVYLLLFLAGFTWNRTMDVHPQALSRYFRANVLFMLLYIIPGLVFYLLRYGRYRELQEKELQLQVRNAELSFLKSQINPHFLFNNLNNIYSLVYRNSPEALNAIAGLSELLRYMLYSPSDTISLRQEIAYIEKYIALQQLRYEVPSKILFTYPEHNFSHSVPPLLLIPFIENAFKHGAVSSESDWLRIIILQEDSTFTFSCSNETGSGHKDRTGGIGIENVRKRLELLYPGRHTLRISTADGLFTVKLKLEYA